MQFGKTTPNQLNSADFCLPSGDSSILKAKGRAMKFYAGMPRWGVKEWVGSIFPAGTKEKDFSSYYMQQFNCIEFNATHYNIYSPERIQAWADKSTGIDFKFCPKMYNGITHRGPLNGKEDLLDGFMQNMSFFGDHLGPVFIQLSETFSLQRARELDGFLKRLPKGFTYFLEIRGEDWFRNGRWFSWLKDICIGSVITDTAGRRDIVHANLTIPKAMIRFVANNHPSDFTRLDGWIKKILEWKSAGIEEVYFFVHCNDELISPNLVEYLNRDLS